MPQRISKIAHQYAERDLTAGESFDVEPQDVSLLLLLGRIEAEVDGGSSVPQASAQGHYSRRDMTVSKHRKAKGRRSAPSRI